MGKGDNPRSETLNTGKGVDLIQKFDLRLVFYDT